MNWFQKLCFLWFGLLPSRQIVQDFFPSIFILLEKKEEHTIYNNEIFLLRYLTTLVPLYVITASLTKLLQQRPCETTKDNHKNVDAANK